MSIDAFSVAYKKKIRGKITDLQHDLGRGSAESYDIYKERSGFINGLEEGLLIFLDTIRQYADLEEDDDE